MGLVGNKLLNQLKGFAWLIMNVTNQRLQHLKAVPLLSCKSFVFLPSNTKFQALLLKMLKCLGEFEKSF